MYLEKAVLTIDSNPNEWWKVANLGQWPWLIRWSPEAIVTAPFYAALKVLSQSFQSHKITFAVRCAEASGSEVCWLRGLKRWYRSQPLPLCFLSGPVVVQSSDSAWPDQRPRRTSSESSGFNLTQWKWLWSELPRLRNISKAPFVNIRKSQKIHGVKGLTFGWVDWERGVEVWNIAHDHGFVENLGWWKSVGSAAFIMSFGHGKLNTVKFAAVVLRLLTACRISPRHHNRNFLRSRLGV